MIEKYSNQDTGTNKHNVQMNYLVYRKYTIRFLSKKLCLAKQCFKGKSLVLIVFGAICLNLI